MVVAGTLISIPVWRLLLHPQSRAAGPVAGVREVAPARPALESNATASSLTTPAAVDVQNAEAGRELEDRRRDRLRVERHDVARGQQPSTVTRSSGFNHTRSAFAGLRHQP
jgi:hypothetical protein